MEEKKIQNRRIVHKSMKTLTEKELTQYEKIENSVNLMFTLIFL